MITNTLKPPKSPIFFIDVLRCIAAFAVVIIHVLGPFRKMYGHIPQSDWLAAITFNGLTRWAVPLFIMISGALLLSSKRPFQCKYYVKNRLKKVVVPFIAWTVIYACINGYSFELGVWSYQDSIQMLRHSPTKPTWYHLWFFYDFIPLYFLVPFLSLLLAKFNKEYVQLLLLTYAGLFTMKWFGVKSVILMNIVLYSGYLVLGWYLLLRDNSKQLRLWVVSGCCMLVLNVLGTWTIAEMKGAYSSFYMGYKTLNTALIAGMIFVVAQTYAHKITGKLRSILSGISRYSLGIFLIHPLFLIPIRNLDNGYYFFFKSNWVAIPLISLAVFLLSLFTTIFLVKLPIFRRLVP